jgi:hypothetical protein
MTTRTRFFVSMQFFQFCFLDSKSCGNLAVPYTCHSMIGLMRCSLVQAWMWWCIAGRWSVIQESRPHRNGKRRCYCRWKFDGSGLLNLLKNQFCELYRSTERRNVRCFRREGQTNREKYLKLERERCAFSDRSSSEESKQPKGNPSNSTMI